MNRDLTIIPSCGTGTVAATTVSQSLFVESINLHNNTIRWVFIILSFTMEDMKNQRD